MSDYKHGGAEERFAVVFRKITMCEPKDKIVNRAKVQNTAATLTDGLVDR